MEEVVVKQEPEFDLTEQTHTEHTWQQRQQQQQPSQLKPGLQSPLNATAQAESKKSAEVDAPTKLVQFFHDEDVVEVTEKTNNSIRNSNSSFNTLAKCSTPKSKTQLAPVAQTGQNLKTPPTTAVTATAEAQANYALGTRCGELFVTENAHRWTFVCAFCNKSTRDIGAFICHIKMRHITPATAAADEQYDDAAMNGLNAADEDDAMLQEEPLGIGNHSFDAAHEQDVSKYFSNKRRDLEIILLHEEDKSNAQANYPQVASQMQGKLLYGRTSSEYFDPGNYLDINMHTDTGELNYNNGPAATDSSYEWQAKRQMMPNPVQRARLLQQQHRQQAQQALRLEQQRRLTFEAQKHASMLQRNKSKMRAALAKHQMSAGASVKRMQLKQEPSESYTTQNSNEEDDEMGNDEDAEEDNDGAGDEEEEEEDEADDADADANANAADEYDDDNDNDIDSTLDDTAAAADSTRSSNTQVSRSEAISAGKRKQIRGPAYCDICNRGFQYYSLYRNHMIKHSTDTPFKCSLCSKAFKSKQAIRYHMKTHSQKKQYNCRLCNAQFNAEHQFLMHVMVHESNHIFPCNECGAILRTHEERLQHLDTHSDERPFACEVCGKRFRLRHHLSNHLKMHWQYRCDYCRQTFRSEMHMRKPYACGNCKTSKELPVAAGAGAVAGASSSMSAAVNPLQLFEAVLPSARPTECKDVAEMVSGGESDFEQDDGEEQDQQQQQQQQQPQLMPLMRQQKSLLPPQKKSGYVRKQRPYACNECNRSYSHMSGLYLHRRTKH